jgi:hypothetical protein
VTNHKVDNDYVDNFQMIQDGDFIREDDPFDMSAHQRINHNQSKIEARRLFRNRLLTLTNAVTAEKILNSQELSEDEIDKLNSIWPRFVSDLKSQYHTINAGTFLDFADTYLYKVRTKTEGQMERQPQPAAPSSARRPATPLRLNTSTPPAQTPGSFYSARSSEPGTAPTTPRHDARSMHEEQAVPTDAGNEHPDYYAVRAINGVTYGIKHSASGHASLYNVTDNKRILARQMKESARIPPATQVLLGTTIREAEAYITGQFDVPTPPPTGPGGRQLEAHDNAELSRNLFPSISSRSSSASSPPHGSTQDAHVREIRSRRGANAGASHGRDAQGRFSTGASNAGASRSTTGRSTATGKSGKGLIEPIAKRGPTGGKLAKPAQQPAVEMKSGRKKLIIYGTGLVGDGGIKLDEAAPKWQHLGNFVVNVNQLFENNRLTTLYAKTYLYPKNIKPRTVSDDAKDFMLELVEHQKFSDRYYSKLNDEERQYINELLRRSGVQASMRLNLNKENTNAPQPQPSYEDMKKRWIVVEGILNAGNNSDILKQEARDLLKYFLTQKTISKQEYNDAIKLLA